MGFWFAVHIENLLVANHIASRNTLVKRLVELAMSLRSPKSKSSNNSPASGAFSIKSKFMQSKTVKSTFRPHGLNDEHKQDNFSRRSSVASKSVLFKEGGSSGTSLKSEEVKIPQEEE